MDVQSGEDLSRSDSVLMRIVDIASMKAVIHVGSDIYGKVTAGQEVRVTAESLPRRSFLGKVVNKAPAVNWRSGDAAVSIEVANPDMVLKPGMETQARLMFDQNNEPRLVAQQFWLNKMAKSPAGADAKAQNPPGDVELANSLKGLNVTMAAMAKELEGREKATKVSAEASKGYFNSLEKIINRCRGQARTTRNNSGLDSTADEIDNMPSLHVDEELLAFGADVSRGLRQIAEQRRSLDRADAITDWVQVEQAQLASGAIKTQGLLRMTIGLAEMRRKMTKHYNLEFSTEAERNRMSAVREHGHVRRYGPTRAVNLPFRELERHRRSVCRLSALPPDSLLPGAGPASQRSDFGLPEGFRALAQRRRIGPDEGNPDIFGSAEFFAVALPALRPMSAAVIGG